jgi:hypothetical protein
VREAVQTAAAAVTARYGDDRVRVVPDHQGGAWVEIADAEIGDPYDQGTSFLICLLPFNLPNADVYPLFLRHDLSRRDQGALGEGFAIAALSWPGDAQPRAVVQVSRRTRANAFTLQTPLQKIEKVLEWVRSR